MSEWQEFKLGELVEIGSSKRVFYEDYVNVGVPFYRSKEIIEKHNGNNISTDLFITKEKFEQIKEKYGAPKAGDLLLTSVGTLGIPYIVEKEEEFYFKDGNLTWFKNYKNNLYNQFLYYWIVSPIGKNALDMISIGSTQAALTIQGLKNLDFIVPPIEEQKVIASVLNCLDDKIDLLHRQNTTLEAMAETLFRQWFVEEAQEDWEDGTLKDEFDFTMGQSPAGSSFNGDGLGVPMFQGNADFGFRFPSERIYTTEPARFAEPMDTLISVRAPVGAQNMAKVKCCIGRGVAAFRYKFNPDFYTYTYFKLRSLMDEIKKFNDEGTVFGSISKSDFENLVTAIPTDKDVFKFELKAKPLNDKIINNCEQIQNLEKLRDNLLPKLMSREVRVNH